MRLGKKASGSQSVSYGEALEVALCYGWIDGQKKSESEAAWLQRFIPRAKKSGWSKINRKKALALIDAGRMKPAGLKAIERAKGDGSWDAAYDSPSTATVPDDLQAALDKNPRSKTFFSTLDSQTGMPSCIEFRPSRRPRHAAEKSNSSSRCWRGMRSCIRERLWAANERECPRMSQGSRFACIRVYSRLELRHLRRRMLRTNPRSTIPSSPSAQIGKSVCRSSAMAPC